MQVVICLWVSSFKTPVFWSVVSFTTSVLMTTNVQHLLGWSVTIATQRSVMNETGTCVNVSTTALLARQLMILINLIIIVQTSIDT